MLQPQRLLHRKPVLQILKVERNGNTIEMDEFAITSATLSLYFKKLDSKARKILLKFSDHEVGTEQKRIADAIKLFNHTPGENEQFKDKSMARYYQQYLGYLKQYSNELSWYHRVTQPGSNRIPTAPCTYHPISVQLTFDCVIESGVVKLLVTVRTREGIYPLEDFRRFYFLLLKENNYYHISLSGYEALEWLEDQPLQKYSCDKSAFIEQVALPLKKFNQTVNYDSLIEKDRLEVLPVKRALLSELNQTFLMITPQFIYDGYLVDGPFSETYEQKTSGNPLIIKRDGPTEKSFTEYLRALHPNFSKQHNGYFYLHFADAQKKQWFIHTYHQLLSDDVELVGMDMLRHFRYSPYKAETKIELLGRDGEFISLEMVLKFGKEKVPLNELQKMLLNGQKVVLLKDGSMGVLGEDWLMQYAPMIKHARIKGKLLKVPRWMALSAGEGDEDLEIGRTLPEEWIAKWKRWQMGEQAMYPLPSLVKVQQLRPYQQKGYDWMNLLAEAGGSACLADDMGLGKTLQTICFIANRLHKNPMGKHLVICPASLIYNWQQEFDKFASLVATIAYHGPSRNEEWLTDEKIPVVITSYGTMRQDVEILEKIHFETVVIDESHHIKNPSTQISRAVGQLVSGTRIALSGTPVMNGAMDLYAQLNFLLPGLLGSREFFRKEYIIPIEQERDAEKAMALQKLISPFVLRRTKEQVAPDLPPKTETVLWCSMGQNQRAAYESIKENIRGSVLLDIAENGLNKGKMGVLAGLMKLRQVCNSCELVKGEDLFTYDSIKSEILIEELKNIVPEHRALVFSQFTSMLDLLERDLGKAGIKFQRLDGGTEVSRRQQLVNDFQEDNSGVKVFLLSLKAGNAGLTLTAADYVFLFDPWWNIAVENQAIDRTHRIGQEKHVFAYRMICKGTIEEKIMRMQERKKKLAEDLVSTDEGFISGLTEADIRYLFE